ncbi:MAG: hypothetical protein HZB56_18170 [Deltaproteobacteria bacterium]|nr:hypothetical protein [Deltaproteobacteria bacterium]
MAALFLTATAAGAAPPRLAIGPVRGDAKRALTRQLSRALCGTFECVPWAEVTKKGKLDTALLRKQGAVGALAGVLSTRTGRVLNLDLVTRGPRPAQSWRLPVNARGLLDADSLDLVKREVEGRFGVAAPPPVAAPPRAPATVPLPPPPVARPPAAAAPTPVPVPVPAPATRPVPASRPPAEAAAPAAGAQWLVAAELGVFLAKRDLTYSGASGPLLEHHIPGMGGPAARLELFPLASQAGALRGLGLSADYARSVLLETKSTTGTKLSTTAQRIGAAVVWRAPPLGSAGLVLTPSVGYENRQLAVSGGLAGLPDTKLSGLRGGLALELPVAPRFTLLIDVAYLRWLTARELVKGTPAFFGGGSAWGLDASGGLGVRLFGPFSIRALVGYSLTRYSLKSPTGAYQATAASDAVLRGSATLRAEL